MDRGRCKGAERRIFDRDETARTNLMRGNWSEKRNQENKVMIWPFMIKVKGGLARDAEIITHIQMIHSCWQEGLYYSAGERRTDGGHERAHK